MIPAPPAGAPPAGRQVRGDMHITNLYHATVPKVARKDHKAVFSVARMKAIGKVLHSDLDLYPFAIRGEHNELLPSAVGEVLAQMGYVVDERHVQAVMDEVTECQRLSRGLNQELLGRGKIGEILRQVNQIRLILREHEASGHNGLRWDQVPCIKALSDIFTAELDRDQEMLENSEHIVICMQHDHKEFASTAESILDDLFALKGLAKRAAQQDVEHQVQAANNRLLKRLHRFKWTRDEVASRIYVDCGTLLNDANAAAMWDASFGSALSVPLETFLQSFLSFTGALGSGGAAPDPLRRILAAFLDECGDGVTTVWSFYRLLCLFGPLNDVVPSLRYEAAGGHFDPVIGVDEAKRIVGGTPGGFVVYPAEGFAEVDVVFTAAKGAVKVCRLSRASGAWEYVGRAGVVQPAERLRDLLAQNPAWQTPLGIGDGAAPEEAAAPPRLFPSEAGTTPLHRACRSNNTGMVRTLLQRGGCLTANLRTSSDARGVYAGAPTPLMLSIGNTVGDPHRICTLLLRAGADVNALDERGLSPLYLALFMNRPGVVDLLREAGARRYTAEGTEPLLLALGPSHFNGWVKHDHALAEYAPSHATVHALLCFYTSVADIPVVAQAYAICSAKAARECAPPPGSRSLQNAEKEAAMLRHATRHETSLRHIKRILREHLTLLETKRDLGLE
eukprot:TRINITY_DN10795_c0_g1_i1.p1 TRINITY_DN10795_c0_g1~~TRINITY_DN10795_c0_g1_i1.p1  ORF type:complete len:676 (+),score=268.19 TRINITY_DN10795_c0_g1_i1:145-2172(+)